jgi:uncharacterized membrane protein YoaK (UPF0700 family)
MHTVGAVAAAPAVRIGHHDEGWLAWVGIVLAGVAGFVDAVGFLGLFRLYAAHMSGNTASAGAGLGRLDWATSLHAGVPILIFLVGVCLGALIKQEGVRRGLRSWFALTCGLEALLLAGLLALGNGPAASGDLLQNSAEYFALIVLPCLAMGIQSATFQRVGAIGVRTTFVTGILTGLGEELVATVYGLRERRPAIDHPDGIAASQGFFGGSMERAALFGGIWAAYLVGGVLAGIGLQLWQLSSLIVPVLALVGLSVVDMLHPLQPGRPADPDLPRRQPLQQAAESRVAIADAEALEGAVKHRQGRADDR